MSAAVDIRDARLRRDVRALHRLGDRVLGEFLVELAARQMIRTEVEQLVARYAAIDPDILDAAGGRWWPR